MPALPRRWLCSPRRELAGGPATARAQTSESGAGERAAGVAARAAQVMSRQKPNPHGQRPSPFPLYTQSGPISFGGVQPPAVIGTCVLTLISRNLSSSPGPLDGSPIRRSPRPPIQDRVHVPAALFAVLDEELPVRGPGRPPGQQPGGCSDLLLGHRTSTRTRRLVAPSVAGAPSSTSRPHDQSRLPGRIPASNSSASR